MAKIARYTTFADGNKLYAAELNGELNSLVSLLAGTAAFDTDLYGTNAGVATLNVDNAGGGDVISAQVGGVTKWKILASTGQEVNTVTAGTAPMTIASTTVVTNLNADYVDGIHGTNMINNSTSDQSITAATPLWLKLITTGGGVDLGAIYFGLDARDGTNNVDAYWRIVSHGNDKFNIQQYKDSDTTWYNALTMNRHDSTAPYFQLYHVDSDAMKNIITEGSTVAWAIGAFYEGALSTGAKQVDHIMPERTTLTGVKMHGVFRSGTLTGQSKVRATVYNSAGTLQGTYDWTIESTDTPGTVYTIDITDISFGSLDYVRWAVITANGHADVSVWLHGQQTPVV
jgi:hypothetical protein